MIRMYQVTLTDSPLQPHFLLGLSRHVPGMGVAVPALSQDRGAVVVELHHECLLVGICTRAGVTGAGGELHQLGDSSVVNLVHVPSLLMV